MNKDIARQWRSAPPVGPQLVAPPPPKPKGHVAVSPRVVPHVSHILIALGGGVFGLFVGLLTQLVF